MNVSAVIGYPSIWWTLRSRFVLRLNPSKRQLAGCTPDTFVTFIAMEAIGELGGLDTSATRVLRDVQAGYTFFRDDDVLVAKITPCFENGKGAIAENLLGGVGFGTTELHVLSPSNRLDARFLFYVTMSCPFRHLGQSAMVGAAGQKRVPESFVLDYPIGLPPVDEQRAIVAFLDRRTAAIDALIGKKECLIELLREKRQALITQAVTKGLDPNVPMKGSGVPWFGRIPQHWEVHQLRRVVARFIDYRGRTPTKVEEGVPLITAGAVRDGRIDHARAPEYMLRDEYEDFMRRGLPEIGDVVFTTEAPLGEVAQVTDPSVAFAQRIILFKVNEKRMTNDFLWLYYCADPGRSEVLSRASGSTAEGIRADRLRGSLVLVPPLAEQRAITAHVRTELARIEPVGGVIVAQLEKLREYRRVLITAAVTGKIDVSNEAA